MSDIKDNKPNPTGKSPTITVRQALEKADLFALRSFLRKEAPRNKALGIKLKTAFIESITLDGEHNKFDALLSELIREDRHGIVVLTKREVKLLADVCASLLQVSATFFSNEAHRDNYDLLIVMLKKLHRYLDKAEEKPIELAIKLVAVYDQLNNLLRLDLAPELRDDIFNDGMRLLGRSYYTIHDIDKNMVPILLKAHSVSSQIHAIKKTVEAKISSLYNDDQLKWSTWYAVLTDLSKTELDVVLLHQVLTHGEIFRVAKNLKTLGYDEAQSLWMRQFDRKINLSQQKSLEWDGWIFRSSLRSHDEQGILNSGMRLLLQTESKEVYQEIKAHYPARDDMIKRLRDHASPALLAEILVFEEDWKELEKLIRAELDIDILLAYMHHICIHSATAFDTISLVVQHFATHFAGTSFQDGLSSVIFKLDDLGFSSVARQLNDKIDDDFPGRFTPIDIGLNISC